ncbi:MAG: DUF3617 family protein [Allosphingosinicella sp.]
MSRSALAFCLALLVPAAAGAAADSGAFNSLREFARAVGMKKGGWHTRVKVIAAEIRPSPGADPAYLAEIRSQIERKIGAVDEKEECSGKGAGGTPRLPGILPEPGCSYSRLYAADGRWSLGYRCASVGGDVANMESEGTYSRTAVTGRHEGDIAHKGVVVHLKAEIESRYVGECRPTKPHVMTKTSD